MLCPPATIVIKGIIQLPLSIAIPAILQIIITPSILIIKLLLLQQPVTNVIPQTLAGSRQHILSMTPSSSLSIQEDIAGNGQTASIVIQILQITCYSTASDAIQMHTVEKIIPMHSVIPAIRQVLAENNQ
jgi:hypothetical protein